MLPVPAPLSGHRVPIFALFVAFITTLVMAQAQAEVRVLTSIKPLQQIAAAVQDGVGSPEVLLPPGASPHHYALRPSDVRRVGDVELLYWIGPDMEGFLPRVLKGRSKPSVAVQDLPGLHLRHFGEDSHCMTKMATNTITTIAQAVSMPTSGCRRPMPG